jgi:hypothetical protein
MPVPPGNLLQKPTYWNCRQQAEVIQNHDKENIRNTEKGEAPYRKYKRLKLGRSHVYDRSSVYIAVVALATTSRA